MLAIKPVGFDCGIQFAMEHYRKKRIRFYEAEALPNEIKVANSGRTQEIASKAARKLKVYTIFDLAVSAFVSTPLTSGGRPRWNSNIQ